MELRMFEKVEIPEEHGKLYPASAKKETENEKCCDCNLICTQAGILATCKMMEILELETETSSLEFRN